MNMRSVVVLVLGIALLVSAGTESVAASKQEQILQRETARLDRTAATPQGEKAVAARLSRTFPVTVERLAALRERGLGYGEITVALSCARSMPGGVTAENVEQVLALRQGPPSLGWGMVAQKLGVKLGACVSQVKKVNNESHREMKKDRTPPAAKDTSESEAVPTAPQEQHRKFTGEGKPMTRGPAAQ